MRVSRSKSSTTVTVARTSSSSYSCSFVDEDPCIPIHSSSSSDWPVAEYTSGMRRSFKVPEESHRKWRRKPFLLVLNSPLPVHAAFVVAEKHFESEFLQRRCIRTYLTTCLQTLLLLSLLRLVPCRFRLCEFSLVKTSQKFSGNDDEQNSREIEVLSTCVHHRRIGFLLSVRAWPFSLRRWRCVIE